MTSTIRPFIRLHDENYPSLLRQIADPPAGLWWEGDASILHSELCVAVVGARECTPYGAGVARDLGRELAAAGVTVVSGLAFGIDAAAHEGALEAKGKTIAVLGSGIDVVAPRRNAALRRAIAEKGLLVSEFAPGTEAAPWTFPQRNRIISGLSKGVVIVEARVKSGALITAECALDQNRDVFAVPGPIHSPMSEGSHRLIQKGAKLVQNVEDILEELGWRRGISRQLPLAPERVVGDEGQILGLLRQGPRHVDELADELKKSIADLSAVLMRLEMGGKIRSLPGSRFDIEKIR